MDEAPKGDSGTASGSLEPRKRRRVRADRAGIPFGAPSVGVPDTAIRYSQLLLLRRSGPEPLYYQLARSLEWAVQSGAIDHGTKLLPESDMAKELNVAVVTVRSAWQYLERKGVITRSRYRGTIIQKLPLGEENRETGAPTST